MNLSEFKAWFDGFTEGMSGLPNKKQWARIQERVEEITSEPTPWPVFVQRYYNPFQPYWTYTSGIQGLSAESNTTGGQITSNSITMNLTDQQCFSDAGRAEYKSVMTQ